MIRRFLSQAALLLLLLASPAFADGKFFSSIEEVPPDLPYQRAFLMFDGKSEVLILQSKYDFGADGAVTDFGWVVPVPTVPRLVPIHPDGAWFFFGRLDHLTVPRRIPLTALAILLLLATLVFWIIRSPPGSRRRRIFFETRFGVAKSVLLITSILVMVLFSMMMVVLPTGAGPHGVEVLSTQRVGIYEVRIVRAEAGAGLVEWLREEEFAFGPADEAVFDDYVDRGWCFVAARVAPGEDQPTVEGSLEGLCAPLLLDFPTEEAVYPLALTGAAGTETEVLLYVLARHQVSCEERLETLRSMPVPGGRIRPPRVLTSEDHRTERPFAGDARWRLPWLTKLKGRLSPEEMREDLVFRFAEKDEEVRGTSFDW